MLVGSSWFRDESGPDRIIGTAHGATGRRGVARCKLEDAVDRPLTLLVASGEPAPARSLGSLARRLAAKLDHDVAACVVDGPAGDSLVATVRPSVERGTARLVVLPLALSPDARVDRATAAVVGRWPRLRLHRGAPLATDDVARMLGDRAREARTEGCAPEDAAVVLVGAGAANPAANAELARLARLVYEAHRFGDVGYAFLDLTTPTVGESIERWARLGAKRVVLVPCVLFTGRSHRRLADQATTAAAAAGVDVAVARPLYPHPALVWALVRRHLEALPDAALEGDSAPYVNPALLRVLRGAHAHDLGPLAAVEARIAALLPPRYRDPAVTVSAAPMDAAGLERGPDGAVAWDRMWQGFCELGLAGGPPHRGTLLEPAAREDVLADPARYADVLGEIGRGIRMVTGLDVIEGPPGWIGVVCASEAMAIWLMRAIVVENVLARRESAVLYLPAGPRFTLGEEIENVVTAMAKTHHYWLQHALRPE
jgi:sirohydrochlorin cobaltochelatase